MDRFRPMCVVVLVAGLQSQVATAQSALRATTPPDARRVTGALVLVLRPVPVLEDLAGEVAEVLEVRNGSFVPVGGPPPEADARGALPPGHLALIPGPAGVRLMLGVEEGEPQEARVQVDLAGDAPDEELARSLALAVEALRDCAAEQARQRAAGAPAARDSGQAPIGGPGASGESKLAQLLEGLEPNPFVGPPAETSANNSRLQVSVVPGREAGVALEPTPAARPGPGDGPPAHRDAGPNDPFRPLERVGILDDIEPTVFAQVYGGASAASAAPQAGAAAGAGLCAVGHCVVLGTAIPMTAGEPTDIRYRYLTFSSTFYSRPLELGNFTPGLGLGLLTRVGHFEADMGLKDSGVDTDLAARMVAELAYRVVSLFDITAEAGFDYGLDRMRVGEGVDSRHRGERLMPWIQAGLRVRP